MAIGLVLGALTARRVACNGAVPVQLAVNVLAVGPHAVEPANINIGFALNVHETSC